MDENNKLRVIIADDNELFRELIAKIVSAHYQVVGSVGDGDELIEAWELHKPDLLLVDIDMPRLNGIDAVRLLREKGCTTPVVILTVSDDPALVEASREARAEGFVIKSRLASDLFEAIRAAETGELYTSPGIRKD